MECLMIIPQKNVSQKLQKVVSMSQGVLSLVLLVCSLVFLPSSYSNAGDGVNSNTIIDGSSTSAVTSGSPISTTVTNEDGSTTTTDVTTITTTTTTKNVTQTEVPNVVTNPTFTNHLGGGSSSGWSITTCPGGCAFSSSGGFKAGNGGTITQTYSQSDLFPDAIDSTEEAQGMSFSFGAEVDNNQVGAGNRADTWSIKLELFDSNNSSLGHTEIGSTVIFAPTIKTGTLDIDSGNVVNSGVLTIFGDTALNGDWRYGPFFTDVFTTFLYNSIEDSITSTLAYETLITNISCEILDTCAVTTVSTAEDIATGTIDVVSDTSVTETVIAAPVVIAPLPTVVASVETTLEVAEIAQISEIANDTTNSSDTGTSVESESVSESLDVEPEPEAKPNQHSHTKKSEKLKVSNVVSKKSGGVNPSAKLRAESKGKKATVKQKAAVKKKAMSKAGNKAVKKMGNKKYSDTNQVKTLVIMQVLGNTRSFFNAQAQLKDTPNFFSDKTIPDNNISDNNYTSYFLFGGSDSDHDALIETQYRR